MIENNKYNRYTLQEIFNHKKIKLVYFDTNNKVYLLRET